MNADVEKAVRRMDRSNRFRGVVFGRMASNDWQTVRQALRDQQEEIEILHNIADGNAELYQHEALRREEAETLLREVHDAGFYRAKITTYFGEKHEKVEHRG